MQCRDSESIINKDKNLSASLLATPMSQLFYLQYTKIVTLRILLNLQQVHRMKRRKRKWIKKRQKINKRVGSSYPPVHR